MIDFFEDFCTLRGVERWVSLTLIFYVNDYEEKQDESCSLIRGPKRSLISSISIWAWQSVKLSSYF